MSRNRLTVIAVIVALFLVAGGFLAVRGAGGGGKAVSVDLKVSGATMTPANPAVHLNDSVTMTITTDRDEEIHLHGYDIPFVCKAGQPLTRTFKADKTGRYDLEIEATSQPVGTFTVSP